jgi:type II secretion system protein I
MGKNKITTTTGFTLLEVLIAITITGVVIGVLSTALIQTNSAQHLLEERLTANIIGQGKMAELICGSEPGLSGDFAKPFQKYKWIASEESVKDGSKKITLTVEWRDYRAFPHQASFLGYRFQE